MFAFGFYGTPSPFTAPRSSVPAEGIRQFCSHEGFEHLPSLQATRAQIGKHALRIAIRIARSSAVKCRFCRQLQIGMWAPQYCVEIGSRRLQHMTSSRCERALTSSPVALAENPHGEPTWREPTRKSTLSTWRLETFSRNGRRLIEASFQKRV
jgi:hypothetical protein